jgi:hypothetical protein
MSVPSVEIQAGRQVDSSALLVLRIQLPDRAHAALQESTSSATVPG